MTNSFVAGATEVMLRFLLTEHPHLPILLIRATAKIRRHDEVTSMLLRITRCHLSPMATNSPMNTASSIKTITQDPSRLQGAPEHSRLSLFGGLDSAAIGWPQLPLGIGYLIGDVANFAATLDAPGAPFTDAVCRKSML